MTTETSSPYQSRFLLVGQNDCLKIIIVQHSNADQYFFENNTRRGVEKFIVPMTMAYCIMNLKRKESDHVQVMCSIDLKVNLPIGIAIVLIFIE